MLPIQYSLLLCIASLFVLRYADGNSENAVWIYTKKQAYATKENITFLALTEEPNPLEFLWSFGDQTAVRTTSRAFIKTYFHPDRYGVTVSVSSSYGTVSSDIYNVVIQRAVHLNRLLYTRSVLLNTPVPFSCQIKAGTDVTYFWDFGDGMQRFGSDTEHHVFESTGEFVVEVTVSNLVSSTSLKGHVFVVLEPCQPPPVKNMGPSKIQVWRNQPVCLGVTYEEQLQCNISQGLHYSWILYGTNGKQLSTIGIKTNQQHLELPEYLLFYGTYRAAAKVQIVGSIVYSTFSVMIEVMPSAPLSIISGGTNVFLNPYNSTSNITVDGRRSYDPDFPENPVSYKWKCRPVNMPKTSCFSEHVSVSSAMLIFPVSALNSKCDILKLTLTVQSQHRSSSSEMFITMLSKPTSIIHVSCKECRGNSVNWNERFSVTAACASCSINASYSWKLYLVNASSNSKPDSPFCSSLDITLPSKLEEDTNFFQQPITSASLSTLPQKESSNDNEIIITQDSNVSRAMHSVEHQNASHLDLLSETDNKSAELSSFDMNEMDIALFNLPVLNEDKNPSKSDVLAENPDEHGYIDYDDFYSGIEEADSGISIGRPTGPNNSDEVIYHSSEYDGDNLVGPTNLGHVVSEKTLLDLHREFIQPALFESFTFTGISSSVLTFKPMMLKPKSLYMLEVSASSEQVLQGKTQLFFSTHPAPEGMVCHVQPSSGFEVHTHFGVFCTSGKEDLLYEYSFSVGNSMKRKLYKGSDYQHYFYLPSGDPYDDYKVTIYITVWNRFGVSTKPCPVNVNVWPSFKRNSVSLSNPDQELFVYGLNNLTNIIRMKNTQDIINYIFLLSATLNRLSLDPESCVELQTQTRSILISVICQLDTTTQELLIDIIDTLVDLMTVVNQVTFDSAVLMTKYIQNLSSLHKSSLLDVSTVKALLCILSNILEAPLFSSRLTLDVLHITTDTVLMYLLSRREPQFTVNTTFIKLMAWQNCDFQISKQSVDLTTFYIPHMPMLKHTRRDCNEKPCCITLIISYKQNPYHWARTALQVNEHVADMKVFNYSTRREIKIRHLSTPLIIEFQKQEERNNTSLEFTLSRSEVNTHHFNITTDLFKKAIQIRLEFRRPSRRTFPILLLFRMHQRPTPSKYSVRKVYHWKGQEAQIFLSPSSLKDAGIAYLMLLNADYDKGPRKQYIADEVEYTLSIDSTQCLVWDGVKDWRFDKSTVLESFNSTKVNCSYNQMSSFTFANQKIQSLHSVLDITEYISVQANPVICIVIVLLVALYAVLFVFCNHADIHVEKNFGTFLLPDNNPSDQFFYAVTINTGLRSGTKMTAKVYIVLYGEKGVSHTRELSSPEHTFFTRNSRTTFILSSAQSLGKIWQVHLWHNGGGMSPSWFLNHVIVKDIIDGSTWTFLAQCWLAVDEGDGRVERKLLALKRQLSFRELLQLNLSDCLKDFHPWMSVYSRPSYSTHTHTQRLSICLLLLKAYMCANCVLIYCQDDQHLEFGLIGISLNSVWTGLYALTLLPLGSLVSFLFRFVKTNKNGKYSKDQYEVKIPYISVQDDCNILLLRDRVPELSSELNRVSCEVLKAPVLESMSCHRLTESSVLQKPSDSISCIEIIEENIPSTEGKTKSECFKTTQFNHEASSFAVNRFSKDSVSRRCKTLQAWCYYGTWALWLGLSATCAIITGILGLKFNSTECLLWIQSVIFSLLFCAFAVHPAMIFFVAVFVTLRNGDQGCCCKTPAAEEPIIELLKNNRKNGDCVKNQFLSSTAHHTEEIVINFGKVLAARQRARHLRLARPPTFTELHSARSQIKKRTHLQKTIRKLVLYVFASALVGLVTYGKFSNDKFHLNQAVRALFTGSSSVTKLDDWWNRTADPLLHELYLYTHDYNGLEDSGLVIFGITATSGVGFMGNYYFKTEPANFLVKTVSLIGEPVVKKMEGAHNSSCQAFPGVLASVFSVFTEPHQCGKIRCYERAGFNAPLGNNRSEASSRLNKLRTSGWMRSSTQAIMLQFTLYSPVYNLFTTVTLLGEMSCMGTVISSVFIYSTRLHHSASALDYCTIAGELFLLFFTLLQLYFQTYAITQKGWCYWIDLWNWIRVIAILLSFMRFFCSVLHSTLITETVKHLQRENFKTFIDLTPAASWEKRTHSLYGLLIVILLIKCCSLLHLNEAMAKAVFTVRIIFSSLPWPLITGVILVFVFSSLTNLVTLPKSVFSLITHGCGIGKLGDLHKNQASWMLCYYGALICIMSFAVKAMVTSILCSAVKMAKYKRRKHHLSLSELYTYIQDVTLTLVGKGRTKWTVHTNRNNFVLEEFEDLVDELLFKLKVMSNIDEEHYNYKNRRCFQSEYDYSSEVGDKNREEMPCVCGEFLYPLEESSLRSLLEWNTLQHFRQSGKTIYAAQTAPQNITIKTLKDSQASVCISQTISDHTKCSEMLKTHRSQLCMKTTEDNDCENAVQTEAKTNHSFTRKSFRQLCLYEAYEEKQDKQVEEEAVNIPGQCC